MICFILKKLEGPLLQCGLYPAVRATCYGIAPSDYNFFGVLDKYNPDTCTFFTPVREMGFTLHEMFEVSKLSMRDLPYEKYILSTKELHLLKRDAPQMYENYREIFCYFHICARWPDRGIEESRKCIFGGLEEKSSSISWLATNWHWNCRENLWICDLICDRVERGHL